jgi:ATP-dependent exoDNAse (exonuclease V) alpha subunit
LLTVADVPRMRRSSSRVAAIVGTRKLARLLDHAHHASAKVVLVGDPCQLPEIEAGGVFTGLAQ